MYARVRPARAHHPADQQLPLGCDPPVAQRSSAPRAGRSGRTSASTSAASASVRTTSGLPSRPQHQLQGVDQDRLSRAGLTGDDVEPGIELDFERFDDGEAPHAQARQHGRSHLAQALRRRCTSASNRREWPRHPKFGNRSSASSRSASTQRVASGSARPRPTTPRSCSPTRAWCSSRDVFTRQGRAALLTSHHLTEVHPRQRQAQRPRERGASPRGTTPSSRCSATSRSGTTSSKTRSSTPGTSLSGPYGLDPERLVRPEGLLQPMTKPPRCGRTIRPSRRADLSAAATKTTSGRWATPDPAARAPSSTTTLASTTSTRDDRRGAREPTSAVGLELWNLVFMQFDRHAEAEACTPLPSPVDRHRCRPRAHRRRQARRPEQLRHRPLSSHRRPGVRDFREALPGANPRRRQHAGHRRPRPPRRFLISEGVFPDKDGRATCFAASCAVRFGTAIARYGEPFLHHCALRSSTTWRTSTPSSASAAPHRGHHPARGRALPTHPRPGLAADLRERRMDGSRVAVATGQVAFRLYDTYGFPVDLQNVMATSRASRSTRPASRRARAGARAQPGLEGRAAARRRSLPERSRRSSDDEFVGYESRASPQRGVALDRQTVPVDELGHGAPASSSTRTRRSTRAGGPGG